VGKKLMEFLLRFKLALIVLFDQILASPLLTFLSSAGLFFSSILFFFLVYWFLNTFHQVSITRHKDKNILGSVVPLPAFQVSDSLKKRLEVRVKNDLRVRDFAGNTSNVSWQSFSQDDSLSRQFPSEGNHWREFREMNLLGLTPTAMVEKEFKKYGLLRYKIALYRDNAFTSIFPIKVLQEYFQVQSVVELQERIYSGRLNADEEAVFQSLSHSAHQILSHVLRQDSEGQLYWLSEFIMQQASETERSVKDKERFRNIFYGEILSVLAPPSTSIDFQFESLPLTPETMDFLYMSTTIATSNVPGEIVAVTNDVRLVMWTQLMFSYFILALNVAALLKLLKID